MRRSRPYQYLATGEANVIGVPGAMGFGVGICPSYYLPAGFTPLPGYDIRGHVNYGNYQYEDGSVMCWIPKFYYKVGTGSNGLSVNVVDIKGGASFANTAAANDAGYALHRAFIDGGVEQPGFFIDKYMCSLNAKGTGWVASSIRNGNPISIHANHNPIAEVTSVDLGNICAAAIRAAKGRSGVNGALDAASIFHCASRFQYAALALLSLAHGQAAASTANCAWWQPGKAYPKGCNNNALRDVDDTSVLYISDGYSNCGKTGSGSLFAKTTHNGQDCGVADLNGLMWEISIGVASIVASKNIVGATKANPCEVTVNAHGYANGTIIMITNVVGMTSLNNRLYTITVTGENTFTLDGVNSSGYTDYVSAGTVTTGTFYAAKQATRMKDFTPGKWSVATDHWGATGIAAMMEPFSPAFQTAGGGIFNQRFGSGNQVLSEATSGDGWLLTGLGIPNDANGMDTSGTDPFFGKDQYFQYIRNDLCLTSCLRWYSGSYAGVWAVVWSSYRELVAPYVGFRCGAYLV